MACDCGGGCVLCRRAKRLATRARNAAERKRQEALAERWPDLDRELNRLGYVLSCSEEYEFRLRSKTAARARAAGGGEGY